MVFFTCNGCGESLKKAQVDKHVNMCRGCQVLSCIDCGKDFWGDDYKNHIKCISEDQKYGGKGYEAKANKGDVKQQQWIQRVHEAMNKPGVSAKLKDVLKQVSTYDNVPRKKAKFQNWMRNSLKIANTNLHEEVWDILAAADSPPEAPQETAEAKQTVAEVTADTNGNGKQNGHPNGEKKKLNKRERKEARQQKNGKAVKGAEKTEEEEAGKKKKKDRKRKHSCEEDGDEEQNRHSAENETSSKKKKTIDQAAEETEETEDQAVPKGKFNWKGNIKAVLRESPDQELPVKKLRKKVLAAYYSFTGERNFKTEEDVLALFNKKINNNPKFKVLKDRVRLLK
ncbi:cell growth-regulating nucleolar protein [Chelmon rostratus]|uniref:cell growth-regulating nucleolar protein n=1 Tax=Chelmon rostratus TaxID=109905 RepID=UPI001BE92A45|nr:cell growth-regulating nucleolar protein [Chelmon rostratus]XP_041811293.1 cell growth-regulating nucleolar protein [Chelmon rostratus]